MTPPVTLCIVNYNGERYLPRTLEAVRASGLRFDEVLLVDDASPDGSVALVRERWPEVTVLAQAKNGGPGAARNAGYAAARNDLVLFIDNDVALAQNAIGSAASISIDDFAKLDLRIGKVLACEFVDGSDKLLRFELDAGELGKRQIFSGIRAAYAEPGKLVGRSVVFIANLAPRKMRFGVSEGMILSAGSGGAELFLLDADDGATAGMPIK